MNSYNRHNFADYLKANIVAYFFIILIFISGVVVGAFAVKTLPDEQKNELISYLKLFFQGISGVKETFAEGTGLLQQVIANNAKVIGLMWILGFTVIGLPLVLFIVFARGFVIGFTVGFLINEYIMKGLVFTLASVLPHNFFAVPALIVTGVSATSFSVMLARRKLKTTGSLFYESFIYTILCLGMLILMLMASFTEVYISPVFMKWLASIFLNN